MARLDEKLLSIFGIIVLSLLVLGVVLGCSNSGICRHTKARAESSVEIFNDVQVKGVVYTLIMPGKENVEKAMQTFKSLNTFYLKEYKYPVIIFYEELSASYKAKIQSILQGVQVKFATVEFPESDSEVAVTKFHSSDVYKRSELSDYEFFLRIEPGVVLTCKVETDIMKSLYVTYFKHAHVMEKYIGNETPLYSISRKYAKEHRMSPYYLQTSLSFFHGCTFDTSLEVGDVGFFASEKYQDFVEYLFQNGLSKYKWTDGDVKAMALNIMVPEEIIELDVSLKVGDTCNNAFFQTCERLECENVCTYSFCEKCAPTSKILGGGNEAALWNIIKVLVSVYVTYYVATRCCKKERKTA